MMVSLARILELLVMSLFCGIYAADDAIICPKGHIQCEEGDQCILISQLCDGGLRDCIGGSDEEIQFCAEFLQSAYKRYGVNRCDYDDRLIECSKFGVNVCMTTIEYCQQEIPCSGRLDWRVCTILKSGRLSSIWNVPYESEPVATNVDESKETGMKLLASNPVTLSHKECPVLYTKVGNDCLSFLHPVNVTWGEARVFCQTIGGDLMYFRDLEQYSGVRTHLQDAMQTQDFWIGGRYLTRDEPKGWTWMNGEAMPIGFPMWAVRYEEKCQTRVVTSLLYNITQEVDNGVCYHYNQAPRPVDFETKQQLCVAITYQHHYSYTDEDCLLKKSPLCVANLSK